MPYSVLTDFTMTRKIFPRYMTVKKLYLVATTIWKRKLGKELTTAGARAQKLCCANFSRSVSVLVLVSGFSVNHHNLQITAKENMHSQSMSFTSSLIIGLITRFIYLLIGDILIHISYAIMPQVQLHSKKIFHHVKLALRAKIQMLNLMASPHDWVGTVMVFPVTLGPGSDTSGPRSNCMTEQDKKPIVHQNSRWVFSGSHIGGYQVAGNLGSKRLEWVSRSAARTYRYEDILISFRKNQAASLVSKSFGSPLLVLYDSPVIYYALDTQIRFSGFLLCRLPAVGLLFLPWLFLGIILAWSHLKVTLFVSNHECQGEE